MSHAWFVALCAATVLVAACGRSDDAAVSAPPLAASDAIPDTVGQSAEGMVAWITALTTEDAEAKEALDVAKFTPPTADDTEPMALN